MKALLVLLGATALSGCVAYGPGYETPYYASPGVEGAAPYVVQPDYGYGAGVSYGPSFGYGYGAPAVVYGGVYAPSFYPRAHPHPVPHAHARPHAGHHGPRHQGQGRRDRDGDGIPNRAEHRPGRDVPATGWRPARAERPAPAQPRTQQPRTERPRPTAPRPAHLQGEAAH